MIVPSESVVSHLRQFRAEHGLRRDGVAVYHYFDTADVRQAVAGVHAYSESGQVTAKAAPFKTPDALVWALFVAGDIGAVRLLPPHQAELLALLQYRLYIDDDSQHQVYVTEFLRHVHSLLEHIHAPEDRLVTRFKAQEAVWSPWRTRLATLLEARILDVDTVRQDYSVLVKTPVFHRLYDCLTDHRPLKSMNNFADAAALASLLDAAERFRAKRADEVPFFYASSSLFDDVLQQTGYRSKLIVSRGDHEIDLLTSWDYLVVRALFGVTQQDMPIELTGSAEDLAALFSQTSAASDLRVLALNGGFANSINDVVQHLFNYRVYQPSVRRLNIADDKFPVLRVESDERRHWAADRVQAATSQLRRNTEEFLQLREIWLDVESALDTFAAELRKIPPGSDPLNIDGLTRFSLPVAAEAKIRDLLLKLQHNDQADFDDIAYQIYHVFRDPRRAANPMFVPVAALLWVLHLNRHLLALLGEGPLHHSLMLLRLATLVREKAQTPIILRLAHELELEWEASDGDAQKRAELGIGTAYIQYRLAERYGFVAGWRSQGEEPAEVHQEATRHIRTAIDRARFASSFNGFSARQQAFAANVHLFYLVEEGSADDVVLRQAAAKLIAHRGNSAIWWFGFDDTLARYFFLRYQRETVEDDQTRLMEWSRDRIGAALQVAPHDELVAAFSGYLQLEYDAHRSRINRKRT